MFNYKKLYELLLKYKESKKNCVYSFRLTEANLDYLKRVSKREDIPVSQIINLMIEMSRITDPNEKILFHKTIDDYFENLNNEIKKSKNKK